MLSHILGFGLTFGSLVWASFVYCRFRKAEGTTGERLFASARDSAVAFANYATAAALSLGNGLLNLSDAFIGPEVRQAIQQYLTPETATGVIAGLVILNVASRFRTLGKE